MIDARLDLKRRERLGMVEAVWGEHKTAGRGCTICNSKWHEAKDCPARDHLSGKGKDDTVDGGDKKGKTGKTKAITRDPNRHSHSADYTRIYF